MRITLFTDGGSRGNPGPAGYGYVVIKDTSQAGAEIILRKCGNYCGITTNNQAEYLGLINGLTWLLNNGHGNDELTIYMDSLLIVNQVKGLYRVKHPDLIPRHQEVKKLLSNFSHWQINHTLREGNTRADSLVNSAIDQRKEVIQ